MHIRIELNSRKTFNTDTYRGRSNFAQREKMKLHSAYKFLTVISIILVSTFILPSFASAVTREADAGCSGNGCSGFNTTGYGNHVTNSSGTGNFAGYPQVRFDAYRPEPSLTPCTPDATDKSLYDDIGVPRNYSGISYLHRHVAVLRSDINVATNGVEGSKYWNSGLKFNLNDGSTAPATDPDQTPTHSNPWIGPNWQGSQRCLPLEGGLPVADALKLVKPVLKVNGRETSESQPARAFLRNKKQTITLDLRTAVDTSAVPQIDISFDFGGIVAVGCDLAKGDKWKAEHPGEELPLFYGCFLATDKKSPFYIKTDGVVFNENGTTTFPAKFKKKGKFGLFVLASYEGRVTIGGNPQLLGASGVSDVSNPIYFNVASIKSVNRKS